MSPDSSLPASLPDRNTAYTTARSDVAGLVPESAREVLDVGCSNGALGRTLMAMVPGRRVSGVELDSGFAAEAAKHLEYVVNADANHLDWAVAFGGRRFDCIVFADVLEHLVDPRACLQQALRYLRPGGSIVVSLPNIRHLSALRAIFLDGGFPQRDRGIFDSTHLRWFTLRDAHGLLADAGLRVSAMSQAMRWGDKGGGRLNKLLNRLPGPLKRWAPLREFLTYQVCLRAELAQ